MVLQDLSPTVPKDQSSHNEAALLFVLALSGGLVLLALRMGNREHRSPPPMMGVSIHAAMALSALLLLMLGYAHR